jgi:enoyl-CoA hydratase/carnithine racemase
MAEQQEPLLLRDTSDGIATLTLNRPKQRNALSMALMGELNAALADIAGDADVQVVVIRGNGPGFCAGHDLKEMRADDRDGHR